MLNHALAAVQMKDPETAKIISERPVVISVQGDGMNTSEVLYEDRWGNQFKTWIEYRNHKLAL